MHSRQARWAPIRSSGNTSCNWTKFLHSKWCKWAKSSPVSEHTSPRAWFRRIRVEITRRNRSTAFIVTFSFMFELNWLIKAFWRTFRSRRRADKDAQVFQSALRCLRKFYWMPSLILTFFFVFRLIVFALSRNSRNLTRKFLINWECFCRFYFLWFFSVFFLLFGNFWK